MRKFEDQLREVGNCAVTTPPVDRVITRGRRIARRRRVTRMTAGIALAAAGAVVAVIVVPRPGAAPIAIAGGNPLAVGAVGHDCQIMGRSAEPEAAEGLRYLPSEVPDGLRLSLARATEGTRCASPPAQLVLVDYGDSGHTVERTVTVWGPGAEPRTSGDVTSVATVHGRPARIYGDSSADFFHGIAWAEDGLDWYATGEGMSVAGFRGIVEELSISAGSVDLTGHDEFTRADTVPAASGTQWAPGWTVMYDAADDEGGQLTITVSPESASLDVHLAPGATIETIRGHRAAYDASEERTFGNSSLFWEERSGVLVNIQASNFGTSTPNLLTLAESLRPIPATEPRINS